MRYAGTLVRSLFKFKMFNCFMVAYLAYRVSHIWEVACLSFYAAMVCEEILTKLEKLED